MNFHDVKTMGVRNQNKLAKNCSDQDETILFRANVQIVPVGKVLVPSELQTLTKDLDVAVKCGTFPNLVQVAGSRLNKKTKLFHLIFSLLCNKQNK